jgi:AcrR family transcriptional regulator
MLLLNVLALPPLSPRRSNPMKDESPHPDTEKAKTILDGATQEFMTNGYAATSMNRIASAAKVSKPTLYSYFQDKAGLFVALTERAIHRQQMMSRLQDPRSLEEPPNLVLRQLATEILDQFTGAQPFFFLIRTIIGESGRFPALAREFVSQTERQNIQVLSQYLANHPQVSVRDPEIAARIFMGTLIHHIVTQEILSGREVVRVDRDRLIDGLIGSILGYD